MKMRMEHMRRVPHAQRMLIDAPFFSRDDLRRMAMRTDPGTFLGFSEPIEMVEGSSLGVSFGSVDPKRLERARKACMGCQVIEATATAGCQAISDANSKQTCMNSARAAKEACCAPYQSMLSQQTSNPGFPTVPIPGSGDNGGNGDNGRNGGDNGDNGEDRTMLYIGGAVVLALVGVGAIVLLRN